MSAKQLAKVRIPVPPVEVQREIARVLDLFSALERELAEYLQAELEARRPQYAYRRDHLFTFLGIDGAKRVPMGEVGVFIRGRRFTKNEVVDKGIGGRSASEPGGWSRHDWAE